MKALMSVVNILAFPLIVLNVLGGISSGIWLGVLGEWTSLGVGLVILLIAPRFLSWSLQLPSPLLLWPMRYLVDRGKAFGILVTASLTSLYSVLLMTIWCCGIFFLFVTMAGGDNFIPHLIWSYGIAIGPWGFLASKDPGNYSPAISTFLAELAYITLMLFVFFATINVYDALKIFVMFMVIALALEIFMAAMIESDKRTGPVTDLR